MDKYLCPHVVGNKAKMYLPQILVVTKKYQHRSFLFPDIEMSRWEPIKILSLIKEQKLALQKSKRHIGDYIKTQFRVTVSFQRHAKAKIRTDAHQSTVIFHDRFHLWVGHPPNRELHFPCVTFSSCCYCEELCDSLLRLPVCNSIARIAWTLNLPYTI